MISFVSSFFFFLARSNCTYTCPSDCLVTKYDLTHSGTPRSKYDLEVYISSLSKKNQEMDQLDKKIKSFNNLCISLERKEQMIKEVEQLRQNIIYSSSYLHFFWQHDTMVSHVRDQVYDLWDMIGNNTTYLFSTLLLIQQLNIFGSIFYFIVSFHKLQLDLEDVMDVQLDFL